MLGESDRNIFNPKTADQYRANDLQVIETEKPSILEEILFYPDGKELLQLSLKFPIHDERRKVIGVLGKTIEFGNLPIIKKLQHFFVIPEEEFSINKLKFLLGLACLSPALKQKINYPSLTHREKEVAYYILIGTRPKEIAQFLDISTRTIETHIKHMKYKLQCSNNIQLEKILRNILLNIM